MKFLSIQSSVAYGHVGNSAAVFPLQRLGHEVWPVSTVVFSNHTGYGTWRGPLLPPGDVADVITGIEERGVLDQVDGVLSGYQGSADIAGVILDAVSRVRAANPRASYTCDPVMGNAGSGCFVHPDIPPVLRERVVPRADIITPNQFELGFLTGTEPQTLDEILTSAELARKMGPRTVLVTSVQRDDQPADTVEMLVVTDDGRVDRADPAAAAEGERLRGRDLRPLHRPSPGDRRSDRPWPHRRLGLRAARRDPAIGRARAPAGRGPGRVRRPAHELRGAPDPMRLLVSLLLFAVVTACGASSTDDAASGDRATDIAFVTELMHRDAALLNLLDVALGRRLDPALVAATDQLRVDANARIETAADQLESWGEKVPRTVRDHSFEHSTDAHDIPSLDGMPTGDDLQRLGQRAAGRVRGSVRRPAAAQPRGDARPGRHPRRGRRRGGRPWLGTPRRSCDAALQAL